MKRERLISETKLRELIDKKLSTSQIAEKLNVSVRQVVCKRNKLKIGARTRFGVLDLSSDEEQVIIGSILGNGWIDCTNKERNYYRLCFSHSIKQELYCQYKFKLLSRIGKEPKINIKKDKREGFSPLSEYVIFKSKQHPIFKEYRDRWYKPNKILCKEDFDKIEGLGLAVWYMDDGWNRKYGASISTQSFSKEDIEYMIHKIKEKFDIKCTVTSARILNISSESKDKFFSLIKKYIPNSMAYKIASN